MKKSLKILLHLGFWFYKFVWGPIMGGLLDGGKFEKLSYYFQPLTFSEFILYPATFYFNYFFIMPRFYKKGKTGKAWIAWILLMFGFTAARYGIEEVLYKHWFGITNYYPGTSAFYYIYDNLYIGGPLIVMSIMFWILDDNLKKQKERYSLLEEKKSAQLTFLKNQVNPHFIFNTLNNIYALVSSNSDKALPSIEKLSQLMRYMYKDSEEEMVNLDEELNYIKSFAELQKIRLNDPSILQMSVPESTGNYKIAPLILIPFIENMFKHGIINAADKPLKINIELSGSKLILTTSNYINNAVKDEASGVGLTNVHKRLELLYVGNYTLDQTSDGVQYQNKLILNLEFNK